MEDVDYGLQGLKNIKKEAYYVLKEIATLRRRLGQPGRESTYKTKHAGFR